MSTTDPPKSNFWRRWIAPRIYGLTLGDWSFWVSICVGAALVLWPLFMPVHLLRGISVESLSVAVITFTAIGLGVSVALGALVATFPTGKLRKALQLPGEGGKPTAFAELAFVVFWAGASNLLTAAVAILALLLAGPYSILCSANPVPAVASGLLCASTVYALLQTLAALVALLETAGLSEKFDG